MPVDLSEILLQLPMDRIIPNPYQPRRRFDETALRELAQSIQTQGMIQPLIVRQSPSRPGFYELIAGERRWRAIQYTAIRQVEAVVKQIEDQDVLEVSLLENIQRENLTPVEEASCYRDLLELHGYTQEELARRIGKDRSTIANLIRLLQLSPAIQNDLEESRLTIGHSRALLSLPSAKTQLQFREQILKNGWSVRQTEQAIKAKLASLQSSLNSKKGRAIRSNDFKHQFMALETELEHHYGTKISINHFPNGHGSIKIEYYSIDDLDRIYELLKSS